MPSAEFYFTPGAPRGRGADGQVRAVTPQVGEDVDEARDPEWRWRLKADNGEIVASGEGHTRREDAERAFLHVGHLLASMWALAEDEVDKTGGEDDDVVVWRWSA